MTIGYRHTFPDGTPTNFKDKILASTKVHTIRNDPHDRWQPGNRIHHTYHNRTPNRHCFLQNDCIWVQNIKIINTTTIAAVNSKGDEHRIGTNPVVMVNGCTMPPAAVQELAKNDGFDDVTQFYNWFSAGDFNGKIIHWTNLKY